jgi:hypothetical protein
MTDISWDTSQIDRLAADLGHGTGKTVTHARAVIEASALRTKNIARRRASGIKHAPSYPNSITYDVHGLTAEIGPDKDLRQGALGNILEFGTSKNGPIPHLGPALTEAGPEFVEGITAVGVKDLL